MHIYDETQLNMSPRDAALLATIRSLSTMPPVLTGSSRWGCGPNARDYDFFAVMPLRDVAKLKNMFDVDGDDKGSLGSITFMNSKINLILLQESDYSHWNTATRMMDLLPEPLHVKTTRHGFFEALRALLKITNT